MEDRDFTKGMIKVQGPEGQEQWVSDYYTRTKDGRDALAQMGFRVFEDVIPPAPKAERPPLIDTEKERLRKENEALLKRLEAFEAGNNKPPVEEKPVTPADAPKRGPGRPPIVPATPNTQPAA